MITKQEFEMKSGKLRALMIGKGLDAILLYGSVQNDGLLWWLAGAQSIEFNYILLTRNEKYIFDSVYFLESLKARLFSSKRIKIICSNSLSEMITSVVDAVNGMASIGYCGQIPYYELIKIKANLVDIREEVSQILMVKTDREIEIISNTCKKCSEILSTINIKPGMSEKDIAKDIITSIASAGGELLSANLSVVASNRLALTTDSIPSDYTVIAGDVICIDCAPRFDNYMCDITRCFFVGENKYRTMYEKLENVQNEAIKQINAGMLSKEMPALYFRLFKKYGLENYFVTTNLGHGIGYSLHEKPDIGVENTELQNGMVLALEPELNTGEIRLRIEDIVVIMNDKAIKVS